MSKELVNMHNVEENDATSHATMQEEVEKEIVGTCSAEAGPQGGKT